MDVRDCDQFDDFIDGPNAACEEGDPKQRGLAEDQDCASFLDALEQLGVMHFTCIIRTRCLDSSDVFTTTPQFKKGTRVSAHLLERAELLARSLGQRIAEAVAESLAGTSADGYDLYVESVVIVADPDGQRDIVAWVTAISLSDSDFERREVHLI
jgi:hypothetical protein